MNDVYLLAGGGTAGHVNPLLALGDEIVAREPAAQVLALGSRGGLEERLVPQRGFELHTIEKLPFPRRPSVYVLKFPVKFRRAVSEVRQLLRERRVRAVVGFGGYASAPAYVAARRQGVPYVIHEANAKPGLANRFAVKHAAAVAVTFASTPLAGAVVTGMPLRKEITALDREALRAEARRFFGLQESGPVLLVTGGSLGARAINEGISSQARHIVDAGVNVLHIWGGLTQLRDPGVPGYRVLDYCDCMDLALAACDVAVSRAGATTVSELSGLGIPAVFVPYGVGNGEQRFNAADSVRAGGSILVEDAELTAQWVRGTLLPLLQSPERQLQMSAAQRSVGSLRGTENLYELLQGVLRGAR